MAKWDVSGADRETGTDVRVVVEASSEESAVKTAGDAGMLVSSVRQIVDGQPVHRLTYDAPDYREKLSNAPAEQEKARQIAFVKSMLRDSLEWYEELPSVLLLTLGMFCFLGGAMAEQWMVFAGGFAGMVIGFLIRINGKLRLSVQKQIMLLTQNYNEGKR